MRIVPVNNYTDMSKYTAEYILKKTKTNQQLTLGLATGGTPVKTYQFLEEDYKRNHTSYEHVTTFNLDEYIGLPTTHPNSYHYYMKEHLFDTIDIPSQQTLIPNGLVEDLNAECNAYEQKILNSNGIDLQILGLGENGHIGFNEPGTSFDQKTHIVTLTDSTREVNARYFDHINEVPKKAITMGIGTIMRSKEILLLVSGQKKRDALRKLLYSEINLNFPASILKKHNRVTIIADEQALRNLNIERSKLYDR